MTTIPKATSPATAIGASTRRDRNDIGTEATVTAKPVSLRRRLLRGASGWG
jgi:hypothetical protein